MRVVPTLGWRLRRRSGRRDRPAPPAAARGDRRRRHRLPRRSPSAASRIAPRGGFCATTSGFSARRSCDLERGRGASLSELGARWLRAQAAARERLARMLPGLAIDLGPGTCPRRTARRHALTVAASHDLALAALSETLPESAGIALRPVGDGKPHRACGNTTKAAPKSPASTCRSARTRAGIARPFLRSLARAPRPAHPLRRSRAGSDPRARQSGAGAHSARRRRAESALRQSPARLGNAAPDRPDDRRRAGSRRRALEGFGNEEFTHRRGGGDRRLRWRGCRIRAARRGRRIRTRFRSAGAGTLLPRRSREGRGEAAFVRLIDALKSAAFARRVRRLPGYHPAAAGSLRGSTCLHRRAKRLPRRRTGASQRDGSQARAPRFPRLRASPPSATPPPDRSRAPDRARVK